MSALDFYLDYSHVSAVISVTHKITKRNNFSYLHRAKRTGHRCKIDHLVQLRRRAGTDELNVLSRVALR